MQKQTVEWFKNPNLLSEIFQQTGMLFAFVSAPETGSKVCHEWVKCRDFLHDAVRSQITGKGCGIYGFSFNPAKNPPIDLKKTRMLVTKDALREEYIPEFTKKMEAGLRLLNHFEKHAKVSLSKMHEIDPTGSGKKAIYSFVSPRMWVSSPFLVSMYTFLIRLGDKEIEFKDKTDLKEKLKALSDDNKSGKISDNDAGYVGKSWDKLHLFIQNRAKLFPKKDGFHDIFFENYGINNFHNSAGILSLANMATPDKSLNERVKGMIK